MDRLYGQYPKHVVDAHISTDLRADGCMPYRLADLVRHDEFGTPELKNQYLKCHHATIGAEYTRRTTDSYNFETLKNIASERCSPNKSNEHLVHLRLGDVLCHNYDAARQRKPPSAQEVAARVNARADGKDVVFVYGNHLHACVDETQKYIRDVTSLVPGSRAETSGDDADADFCRMVMADTFAQSTGGFGEVVAGVRSLMGKESWKLISEY